MTSPAAERLHTVVGGIRHPVVAVGLGMIALHLGFRAWALYPNWFYTDDYLLLLEAQEQGLSTGYLMTPSNGHLMPGTRFLYWWVEGSGVLNWPLAATITLVLQAAAALAALWMLVTLFGPRWGVLAPLSIFLTTAITAQATMWWVSSVNQIPVQIAFFLAVGTWTRYLRSRSMPWLLATALALVFGLLFFQKTLLVLPVLIFLAVAYFASGSLPARVVQVVRRYWPAAVVIGLVSGGYVWYYLTEVQQPFVEGSAVDLSRLTSNMSGIMVSGALGGPWGWQSQPGGAWADTAPWLQAAAWVVAGLVVAYSVVKRAWAWPAWLLLAGYLSAGIVLVATSRAPLFGAEIGLAYRFQTEAVCALVLCVGLAFLSYDGAVTSSRPRASGTRVPDIRPRYVVAALLLVNISGLVCWTTYAADWRERNTSDQFFNTLGRQLHRLGPTALANRPLPKSVLSVEFFATRNSVQTMTPLLNVEVDFPVATPRLTVVSDRGTLHQALVDPQVRSAPGPQPDCGWLAQPPSITIPLNAPTLDLGWWVRIGYLSNADDEVRVTAGGRTAKTVLEKDLGSIYVQTYGVYDSVTISQLDPDTRVCVDVVEVGPLKRGPAR